MKRKLVNLGIFSPNVCRGIPVENEHCRAIYSTLRNIGFLETRWQLIFDGQIGGLVYPYNAGLNEIHIRFYSDRIFAELEFSRSSVFHFIFPQFNANDYVVDLLRNRISPAALELLIKRTTENLRDEELSRPAWAHADQDNPYKQVTYRGHRLVNLATVLFHKLFGWRRLAGVVATGLAIPIYLISASPPIVLGLSLITLLSIRYMPTVGRP
jgi:hypothetical protein